MLTDARKTTEGCANESILDDVRKILRESDEAIKEMQKQIKSTDDSEAVARMKARLKKIQAENKQLRKATRYEFCDLLGVLSRVKFREFVETVKQLIDFLKNQNV